MDMSLALAPIVWPRKESARATRAPWRAGTIASNVAVNVPDEESDEMLVAAVAGGDQRAFALIVRRHGGRLKALALGFSGIPGEADDIVQETFWSFWRHAGRWTPSGPPLSAYLARIAMNRAIDAGRRRKVRAFFGIEDAAEIADAAPAADEQMTAGSELAAVSRDLLDLPARQREAILLAADGATSNGEIAAVMQLSIGAVEQLLVRARRTLRVKLAARSGDTGETAT
jgi:RNA polymerase sigma-70 factor (ECF subfamily)